MNPTQFVVDGIPHFKTKRCRELDEVLGDTATSISEHETAIMVRLTNHILAKSEMLLMPTRYAALLDCLLSLAGAAVRYNWRRPYVAEQIQQMQITNGRHPLQELCSDIFVANHTLLGQNARMAVLTGPNACGKSVYLKQVGLIAYLAHLGSWVPAEVAVVPIIDQVIQFIRHRTTFFFKWLLNPDQH
jgi:DNA mismatch repair protein MSH5